MFRPGAVIIIHDRPWTVETLRMALPQIVSSNLGSALNFKSLKLCTLTEMAKAQTNSTVIASQTFGDLKYLHTVAFLCCMMVLAAFLIGRERTYFICFHFQRKRIGIPIWYICFFLAVFSLGLGNMHLASAVKAN
jgi:hypothetical protein